jgi:hypothetical protein
MLRSILKSFRALSVNEAWHRGCFNPQCHHPLRSGGASV